MIKHYEQFLHHILQNIEILMTKTKESATFHNALRHTNEENNICSYKDLVVDLQKTKDIIKGDKKVCISVMSHKQI